MTTEPNTRATEVPAWREWTSKEKMQIALDALSKTEGVCIKDDQIFKQSFKTKPGKVLMEVIPVKGYGYSPLGELLGVVVEYGKEVAIKTDLIRMSELRNPRLLALKLEQHGRNPPLLAADLNSVAAVICAMAKVNSFTVFESEGIHWLETDAERKPIAVIGKEVYGQENEKVIPILSGELAYVIKGDLLAWQKRVLPLLQGNHLPILTMCFGLVPPLAKLMGYPGFGLQVKDFEATPILGQLVSHLSGPPRYPMQLPFSKGGLELLLRQSMGRVVVVQGQGVGCGFRLDEALQRLDTRHDLGNPGQVGFGAASSEQNFILTASDNPTVQVGVLAPSWLENEGRLITLPVNGHRGDISEFIDATNDHELLAMLDEAMQQNFGVVSPAWIKKLIANFCQLQKKLPARLKAYEINIAAGESAIKSMTATERQVLRHFAFTAVAGKLAIAWEVLPLKADAPLDAARHLFSAWLDDWRGRAVGEAAQPLQTLRAFFLINSTSLFLPLSSWIESPGHVAGYTKVHAKHGPLYLIKKNYFEQALCKNCGVAAMVNALKAVNGLVADPRGNVFSVRMPGSGMGNTNRETFYAIKDSVRFDQESPNEAVAAWLTDTPPIGQKTPWEGSYA